MINIMNTQVMGFEGAIRGMRNPMNSWDKNDSWMNFPYEFSLGENDKILAKKLVKAGSDHRKFMRMIHVQTDVLAPLYWWKEFDTYKVGTVANSCSTMHTIHKREFTLDDFSHEHLMDSSLCVLEDVVERLNFWRIKFIEQKNADTRNDECLSAKECWWQMIQLLPSSYNQMRTIDLNYEVLFKIYHARKNHKLNEWREFCDWIETLPYAKEFLGLEVEE